MQAPGLRQHHAQHARNPHQQKLAALPPSCRRVRVQSRWRASAPGDGGAADGAGEPQGEPKRETQYRGPRMSSEELRARLLRNAQRTDAAKAGNALSKGAWTQMHAADKTMCHIVRNVSRF